MLEMRSVLDSFQNSIPHIDTCGFESYAFRCECCGSAIGGVINPLDDKLHVSLLDPAFDMAAPLGRMTAT